MYAWQEQNGQKPGNLWSGGMGIPNNLGESHNIARIYRNSVQTNAQSKQLAFAFRESPKEFLPI